MDPSTVTPRSKHGEPPDAHEDARAPAAVTRPAAATRDKSPARAPAATALPSATALAVPEQLLAGVGAAALVATADTVVAAVRAAGLSASVLDFIVAALYLFALYVPLGLALGLLAGPALAGIRRARWLDGVRLRLSVPRRWLDADPRGFSTGIALLFSACGFAVTAAIAAFHFATRYHEPRLAAVAMAAVAVALVAVWVVVAASIAALVYPIARRVGRVASIGAVVAATIAVVVASIVMGLHRAPRVLVAYSPLALAWLPLAAAAYLTSAIALRSLGRRAFASRKRALAVSGAVLAATCLAFVLASQLFGESARARGVVERRTVGGAMLVHGYQALTDWDGDGYAWAFGGGDCDDFDARSHPGALDTKGDGVDRDCYGGDGTPPFPSDFDDGRFGAVPASIPAHPNFLFVTIDALRPDHLSGYGYRRPTSPNIDRFARESVRFRTVVSSSSRSLRAIPAMMTGFYPSQLAFGSEYVWVSFGAQNVTAAELLRDHGYATAVTMATDYFDRVPGFFQGFDEVNQIPIFKPPRNAAVDSGIQQLERLTAQNKPWFLWVHLFHVHEPYLGDGAPSRFGPELIDKYDTEITHADREVARLLARLDALGQRNRTVVFLASDHGEAFGEHGQTGHCRTLYEEELRSVLMVRAPGIPPHDVRGRVSLIDFAPTVLNLARLRVPKRMPARSLVPSLTPHHEPEPDRMFFAELIPDGIFPIEFKSIHRGNMKLIWSARDGRTELYDLDADPNERENLVDEQPDDAAELMGLLRSWVADTNRVESRQDEALSEVRLAAPPAQLTRRLDAHYPGFDVLGFDLPRTTFRPEETIPITFYYRVTQAIESDLFFQVEFNGPPGYVSPPHFHGWHWPMNGRYPTNQWRPGEILRDPLRIIVHPRVPRPVRLHLTLVVVDGNQRVLYRGAPPDARLPLTDIDIR